jgi:hypothetical protein
LPIDAYPHPVSFPDRSVDDREEYGVSATTYLAWSAAIGAAGCGRCANAA